MAACAKAPFRERTLQSKEKRHYEGMRTPVQNLSGRLFATEGMRILCLSFVHAARPSALAPERGSGRARARSKARRSLGKGVRGGSRGALLCGNQLLLVTKENLFYGWTDFGSCRA